MLVGFWELLVFLLDSYILFVCFGCVGFYVREGVFSFEKSIIGGWGVGCYGVCYWYCYNLFEFWVSCLECDIYCVFFFGW